MKKFFIISSLIFTIMFAFYVSRAIAVNSPKWNLHFKSIEVTEGSVKATLNPTFNESSGTEITYSVNLNTPGDFYEFTVDVVNSGSLDAMVSEVNRTELTDNQKKYLDYEVTYTDGTKIKQNDKLKAGTTEKLRVRLEFKKDIDTDDLPKEETTLTLSLNTYYIQADDNAIDRENGDTRNNTASDEATEKTNDISSNVINNKKTGDVIMTYIIVFILALIALIITKNKLNMDNK